MSGTNEPGYLIFHVFALAVNRENPELYKKALAAGKENVKMAMSHCRREDRPSFEAQLRAADDIQELVGLMKLLGKDRPEDLPDLGPNFFRQ